MVTTIRILYRKGDKQFFVGFEHPISMIRWLKRNAKYLPDDFKVLPGI